MSLKAIKLYWLVLWAIKKKNHLTTEKSFDSNQTEMLLVELT